MKTAIAKKSCAANRAASAANREASAAERKKRQAKINAIAREFEEKKRALGLQAPAIKRGPMFYLVVLLVLFAVGSAVLDAAGKGGARKRADVKLLHAQQSVDALAQALGRFKFHTGVYPDAVDGLRAIFRNDVRYQNKYPGWLGRYAQPRDVSQNPIPDPWKRPYFYAPPAGTNAFPALLSLGPDGVRGTADDVAPDPASFLKPFHDVAWTNNWAPFWKRGFIVQPRTNDAAQKVASTPNP